MTDLIIRQSAIDAILHNQEVYSNNFGDDPIDKYTVAIIDNDAQTIAQLPSAQPEFIRCRDCKHWDETWTNTNWSPDCHYCSMIDGVYEGDFYCAYAERRIDDLG